MNAAAGGLSRRRFLCHGTGWLWVSARTVGRGADAGGNSHPLASFDAAMADFMAARRIPGGALAVVRDRQIVYAKGYGWANVETREAVRPQTLFRIASVSKPITAVTVMGLVGSGRLELDTRVFDCLDLKPVLAAGAAPDPRLRRITVRHLLQHTAGWDRTQSGDPMFQSREIAQAVDAPTPATPDAIIRYMLGRSLDFDPGTRHAYSNFGYCVLGRLIEKLTGRSYEHVVREDVFARAGIHRMWLGRSRETRTDEAHYYTTDGATGRSVFADETVPEPYGTFCLESMDAHGGWVASALDLARFAAALEDPQRSLRLGPETVEALYAPPPPPVSREPDGRLADAYYGCGWMVRPAGRGGRPNYWHNGSLPGTASLLVRRGDGLSWVVLFNQRSSDRSIPDSAIDPALHRAADAVREWPAPVGGG